MAFLFNVARGAIRKSSLNCLRDLNRKGAILGPVPQPHWNIDIFQTKSPRRRKDFRVGRQPLNRCSPGAALTFETRLKCDRVFQGGRVARLQLQPFDVFLAKTGRSLEGAGEDDEEARVGLSMEAA